MGQVYQAAGVCRMGLGQFEPAGVLVLAHSVM
jgi:hypothetical protein